MATDTSERGLERLICTALAGHPCDPPREGKVAEARPAYGRVGWIGGNPHDYDREFCVDFAQLTAFLRATQSEAAESLALDEGGPNAPQVPGPAAGRGLQARHRRRPAPRHQVRRAQLGAVLRHTVGRKPAGAGTLRAEPLHGRPAATVQPRRLAASARHRPLRQRPARLHLRAEEQPDQADGGRRSRAVPQGPQPAREAVRAGPLRGALRGGRERGALLHAPQGEGVLVPAVQPGLERRRRESAQPERRQDRLPVAPSAGPREPHQHSGELRPGGGGQRREDRQEKRTQVWPRYH